MQALKIENIVFAYTNSPVIDGLSLTVEQGEMVLITGENGCGKSTLLKLILGELKAQKGSIQIFEKNIEDKASLYDVAYVPQMNVVNQIPFPITCEELVVLNLYTDFGVIKQARKKHYQKAIKILESLDLGQYAKIPFNELSGGLQQRVMIARAMINQPKLLILDEPTAGVDKESKDIFYGVLQRLKEKDNLTVMMVSHELEAIEQSLNIDSIYRVEKGVIKHVRV